MATGVLGKVYIDGNAVTNVQQLYQVPADTFSVVTVTLCNQSAVNAINIRIAVTTNDIPGGIPPDDTDYIEYDAELLPNGVLERGGIVLDAGQIIAIKAASSGISAMCYGIETTTL